MSIIDQNPRLDWRSRPIDEILKIRQASGYYDSSLRLKKSSLSLELKE